MCQTAILAGYKPSYPCIRPFVGARPITPFLTSKGPPCSGTLLISPETKMAGPQDFWHLAMRNMCRFVKKNQTSTIPVIFWGRAYCRISTSVLVGGRSSSPPPALWKRFVESSGRRCWDLGVGKHCWQKIEVPPILWWADFIEKLCLKMRAPPKVSMETSPTCRKMMEFRGGRKTFWRTQGFTLEVAERFHNRESFQSFPQKKEVEVQCWESV